MAYAVVKTTLAYLLYASAIGGVGFMAYCKYGPKPATLIVRPLADDDSAVGKFMFQLNRCTGPDDKISMHGLWPQWAEYCDGEEFDVSKLKDIRDRMDRDWFGCHGDSEGFWNHEWERHGRCAAKFLNTTQEGYFKAALDLFDKYHDQCHNELDVQGELFTYKDPKSGRITLKINKHGREVTEELPKDDHGMIPDHHGEGCHVCLDKKTCDWCETTCPPWPPHAHARVHEPKKSETVSDEELITA